MNQMSLKSAPSQETLRFLGNAITCFAGDHSLRVNFYMYMNFCSINLLLLTKVLEILISPQGILHLRQ